MLNVLYAVFIFSGAAGLIYESIWTRYLGLFVGHSAYAQIIVLTIFLGGMSLGALLIGRRSRSIAEPLAWYSYIEMTAGPQVGPNVLEVMMHELREAARSTHPGPESAQ